MQRLPSGLKGGTGVTGRELVNVQHLVGVVLFESSQMSGFRGCGWRQMTMFVCIWHVIIMSEFVSTIL